MYCVCVCMKNSAAFEEAELRLCGSIQKVEFFRVLYYLPLSPALLWVRGESQWGARKQGLALLASVSIACWKFVLPLV